jgi:hypothetical protein
MKTKNTRLSIWKLFMALTFAGGLAFGPPAMAAPKIDDRSLCIAQSDMTIQSVPMPALSVFDLSSDIVAQESISTYNSATKLSVTASTSNTITLRGTDPGGGTAMVGTYNVIFGGRSKKSITALSLGTNAVNNMARQVKSLTHSAPEVAAPPNQNVNSNFTHTANSVGVSVLEVAAILARAGTAYV